MKGRRILRYSGQISDRESIICATLEVEDAIGSFGSPMNALNFALKFMLLRTVSLAFALPWSCVDKAAEPQ